MLWSRFTNICDLSSSFAVAATTVLWRVKKERLYLLKFFLPFLHYEDYNDDAENIAGDKIMQQKAKEKWK